MTIVTIWFVLGLLNAFIKAVFAIIGTALLVLFKFFFGWIGVVLVKIANPFRKIHFPPAVKAFIYLFIGALIFYMDHIFGKQLFEMNETISYNPAYINGTKFWVSDYAYIFGGIFLFIGACYVIGIILGILNKLIDHPMRISLNIYR